MQTDLSTTLMTANQPGAIAIVQVHGAAAKLDAFVSRLTGREAPPAGSMRMMPFHDGYGEIDTGLVARVGSELVHLMPHGGLRVVQRVLHRCAELGASVQRAANAPPAEMFSEAGDSVEALMLATLARARSPLAIDLLLDQPRRWRDSSVVSDEDRARSNRLQRLIDPPLVVLTGPANVGKSTLSNALSGRTMSIAVDQPGTTRDYTTGLIELRGLVVQWHDTPGLRETDDPIERKAIELARDLMQRAEYLIAMTDHEHDWPALPREPDVRVACKCDIARRDDADVCISNTTGEGVSDLVMCVCNGLVPAADLEHPGPWVFDARLLNI